MPKKQGGYAKTLVASAKNIAGTNPVGKPETVGVLNPTTVPKKLGVAHGLGPVTEQFGHASIKGEGSKGYGRFRLSGHPHAHRIGERAFKPKKVF
jgi:hypothetical protein